LLSAFFSLVEAAFLSVPRSRVSYKAQQGSARAAQIEQLMQRPERFLATILFGNDLANTAAGVLGAALALSILGPNWGVVAATLIMAALVLIFGDAIPKSFAVRHAEGVAMFSVGMVKVMESWLSPLVTGISWVGAKFAGGKPLTYLTSEDEIRSIIAMGERDGTVEKAEAQMLHKVFEFGDRPVRDVMTPRPDIIALEKGSAMEKFFEIYARYPHSRFLVYEGSLDNIVGLVTIKDLLMVQAQGSLPSTIDPLVRPIPFVPLSKRLGRLFTEMQASGVPMVAVVDEYGGITGIATMGRLVEEIVGEMKDELALEEKEVEAVGENSFEVDASLRIDEANQQLALGIPSGDYETLAGFALSRLGHVPRDGEQFKYDGWKVVVVQVKGLRIEKLLISKE
jgi:putative hemolysin